MDDGAAVRVAMTIAEAGEKPGEVAGARLQSANATEPFNRRDLLDSLTERLAHACARTAPHPYRVIIAG